MQSFTLLGTITDQLLPSLLKFSTEYGIPTIQSALIDPNGYISRIGDVVVWNTEHGQQVLAGLQQVTESQSRIETAVAAIENTQIGIQSSIGGLHTIAMATFGVTSLTGGLMLWRLHALNRRFDGLESRIADIENNLNAQNKAHLLTAIQKLREYDEEDGENAVAAAEMARDEAQRAANIYGQLAYDEARRASPRLEVLNYRGRCYLLSLLTELRSRMLLGKLKETTTRFNGECPLIGLLAKRTFECAIGASPESFLSFAMKQEGVSLELMTDLYRSAGRFDPRGTPVVRNTQDMFELCRPKGITGQAGSWWPFGDEPSVFANRLKFALACFEDIGRVEALHLIACQLSEAQTTLSELQARSKEWASQQKSSDVNGIMAYTFPQPLSTAS